MLGPYLIGWAIGRGFIFSAAAVFFLYRITAAIATDLADRYAVYREAHPRNKDPARIRRNTIIFWSIWASVIILDVLLNWILG
jgi:hypothetical protein